MNKNLKIVVVTICLSFLVGCGNNNMVSRDEYDLLVQENDDLKNQIIELQNQNLELSDLLIEKESEDEFTKDTSEELEDDNSDFEKLEFGEQIKTEFTEITFDGVGITDEIQVPMGSFPSQSNDTCLLYLKGTIKNTSSNSFETYSYANIVCNYKINDQYDFFDFTVFRDDGAYGSFGTALNPTDSDVIYLVLELPVELKNQVEKVEIKIGFDEEFEDFHKKDISLDSRTYKYIITSENIN